MLSNIKTFPIEKILLFFTILLALTSVTTKELISDDHVGILILFWMIYKFGYQKTPFKPEISKHAHWLTILIIFWVLSLIPIAFHSNYGERTFNALNDYSSAVVLAIVLTLLLSAFRLGKDFFWFLMLSTSLLILYIIFKESYIVGLDKVLSGHHRFGRIAGTYQIDFGWFSNSLFVILIGIFPWARSKGYLIITASIITLIITFSGTIFSESRTAWIGWPAAFVIWGVYYAYIWKTSFKFFKLSGTFILISLVGYILWQQSFIGGAIKKRANDTILEFDQYINKENPKTSIGYRMVMYEIAIEQIKRTPVLGINHDQVQNFIKNNSRKLLKNKFNQKSGGLGYAHIHNQFLMALLTGGIIAFSGLLIFVIWVIYFFYRGSKIQGYYNTIWPAGLVFMVTSVLTFFPETPFHTKTRFLCFIIFLSLFMAVLKNEDNSINSKQQNNS